MSPSHIKATSEDDDTIASVGAELFAAPLRCRLSEARKEAIVVCSVDVCQMIVFFLHASTCALASSTAAVASVASATSAASAASAATAATSAASRQARLHQAGRSTVCHTLIPLVRPSQRRQEHTPIPPYHLTHSYPSPPLTEIQRTLENAITKLTNT